MTEVLVFCSVAYQAMGEQLCRENPLFVPGKLERRTFPDGERYLRLLSDCTERDVVLLGGTVSDSDTLELYDLACGIAAHGARRLSLVIPYFSYSTMERAVHPGEIVTAKTRAHLLSTIPSSDVGNRVFLLDLHAAGIPHYFDANIRAIHVYAKPIIKQAALRLGGDDFVIGCTDAGRAKWVASLANDIGVDAAFVYKRRIDGEQTEITGVSAAVRGRYVVIYDDMIRTGGSLLGAARAYAAAGAAGISALTTHGLFPGEALARLQQSGLFDRVVCTDSHPRANQLASDFLEVLPVAPLLAEALRSGHSPGHTT